MTFGSHYIPPLCEIPFPHNESIDKTELQFLCEIEDSLCNLNSDTYDKVFQMISDVSTHCYIGEMLCCFAMHRIKQCEDYIFLMISLSQKNCLIMKSFLKKYFYFRNIFPVRPWKNKSYLSEPFYSYFSHDFLSLVHFSEVLTKYSSVLNVDEADLEIMEIRIRDLDNIENLSEQQIRTIQDIKTISQNNDVHSLQKIWSTLFADSTDNDSKIYIFCGLYFSTFYGSISCLKYILLNTSDDDKQSLDNHYIQHFYDKDFIRVHLFNAAIYSGNTEIIKLISELCDNFRYSNQYYINLFGSSKLESALGYLQTAIASHHNNIAEWIKENFFEEKDFLYYYKLLYRFNIANYGFNLFGTIFSTNIGMGHLIKMIEHHYPMDSLFFHFKHVFLPQAISEKLFLEMIINDFDIGHTLEIVHSLERVACSYNIMKEARKHFYSYLNVIQKINQAFPCRFICKDTKSIFYIFSKYPHSYIKTLLQKILLKINICFYINSIHQILFSKNDHQIDSLQDYDIILTIFRTKNEEIIRRLFLLQNKKIVYLYHNFALFYFYCALFGFDNVIHEINQDLITTGDKKRIQLIDSFLNTSNESIIMAACYSRSSKTLKKVLKICQLHLNKENVFDELPISVAYSSENLDLVKILLSHTEIQLNTESLMKKIRESINDSKLVIHHSSSLELILGHPNYKHQNINQLEYIFSQTTKYSKIRELYKANSD
ncbi:hypothetical protein TRFO_04667 [Tritrichomonas foetus]|uniref:Uncharacterized protein n=1 Tax=Tritrichomonas foetus TaxID=1144522 RepID=A0A1J4KGY4_9EUKA|nr:hypothetical protein TRFO_04667 [Tritrichomonas foetus]|eukprot:OHT09084.1 hypothetical protein TRFO_04667 [Tritrichomonas foetus]